MVGAAAAVVVTSCGDPKDQALCPAYQNFLETRSKIDATDPTTQTAAEVKKIADDYLQQAMRLREVADTRYPSELDALLTATNDVRRTLASVQDDADYSTWEPLVEDSLTDVRTASARLSEAIEPTCPSNT